MSFETGTVLRFDQDRGFGFIQPDDGSADLFMHVSGLADQSDQYRVRPGSTRVQFERAAPVGRDKGPKATRVTLLEEPSYGTQYDEPQEQPVQPTEAAWRKLWDDLSEEGFQALMRHARANGWVQ